MRAELGACHARHQTDATNDGLDLLHADEAHLRRVRKGALEGRHQVGVFDARLAGIAVLVEVVSELRLK
eukprot:1142543-Prorocentrum_lima.AAC.1